MDQQCRPTHNPEAPLRFAAGDAFSKTIRNPRNKKLRLDCARVVLCVAEGNVLDLQGEDIGTDTVDGFQLRSILRIIGPRTMWITTAVVIPILPLILK